MKRAIRSLALVLAAVAGLVAFTPTEARADHYWSPSHHRYVTYHVSHHHPDGYPVYVNEFGRYFRHGRDGHRIFVSSHHGRYVPSHHGYEYESHHAGLFWLLFGH